MIGRGLVAYTKWCYRVFARQGLMDDDESVDGFGVIFTVLGTILVADIAWGVGMVAWWLRPWSFLVVGVVAMVVRSVWSALRKDAS